MAVMRPLSRPPIREAIVEVKSELVDFGRLAELRDRLAPRFPVVRPFRLASVALHLPDERRGTEGDPGAGQQTGWRCESADGAEVVLLRNDGLSYARLASYPGWAGFVDRFLQFWGAYVDVAAPPEISRIALRYVNDLRLPVGGHFDFERFLTSVPRAPQGLAPEIIDFLVQMTLPGGEPGQRVAVTQATDTAGRSDRELPVILDIDASWERTLSVDGDLPRHLPEALSSLRDLKNRAFFGLVTEELVSAYT
jgi:uncharacterized protein (TIGR04255 family)